MDSVNAFDALANTYDAVFTDSVLGRAYRRAAWNWLDTAFLPGQHVLELGCGTGEDAVHLARRGVRVHATDVSPQMVETARAKAATAGLGTHIRTEVCDVADVGRLIHAAPFDGAYSTFGALNCVADLAPLPDHLDGLLRPGARMVLGMMGPVVPWEWVWYLLRGRPDKAFRRLRPGGARWRSLTVRYRTIGAVRRTFESAFRFVRVGALGALLPPPYAEGWAGRHPRLVERLERWERSRESTAPLPWLADHFQIEFERR